SLQRCIAGTAPRSAEFTRWRVEYRETGIANTPPDKSIDPAPVTVFTGAYDPLIVLARARVREQSPQPIWLIRHYRRAEHFRAQQAARRQRIVANHLGFDAETRRTREKHVRGITFLKLRRHRRRLAVSARS